jgi:hypothetical protein
MGIAIARLAHGRVPHGGMSGRCLGTQALDSHPDGVRRGRFESVSLIEPTPWLIGHEGDVTVWRGGRAHNSEEMGKHQVAYPTSLACRKDRQITTWKYHPPSLITRPIATFRQLAGV